MATRYSIGLMTCALLATVTAFAPSARLACSPTRRLAAPPQPLFARNLALSPKPALQNTQMTVEPSDIEEEPPAPAGDPATPFEVLREYIGYALLLFWAVFCVCLNTVLWTSVKAIRLTPLHRFLPKTLRTLPTPKPA